MKKKNDKTLILLVSVFLIVSLIVYGITKINSRNFNNIKIDKSKYLVYTNDSKKSGYYDQIIPFINIKGDTIDGINNEIVKYINSFKDENIEVKYEYNINGIVLSLIIIIKDHSKIEDATITHFLSYNINLKTIESLSDEVILDLYNLKKEDVNNILSTKINNKYYQLVNDSIINQQECDYKCFLSSRGINSNNYLDGTNYFIRNGQLLAFKSITYIPFSEKEKIDYEFELSN